MSKMPQQIIIRDDKFWRSVGTDIFTTVSILGPVLIGHYIGNLFIQILFGVLSLLWMIGRFNKKTQDAIKTIPEARKYLDELEKSS